MKSLRNKVILSAAVLLFALVATVGSTYAWFTVASTNTVNAMTLNVQAADSLLIKVADPADPDGSEQTLTTASTYYTTITTAMVTGLYSLSTWRLAPVTAVNATYTSVTPTLNEFTTDLNALRALDAVEVGTFGTGNWGADTNSATGKVITIGFWVMSQAATAKNIAVTGLTLAATNSPASRDAVIQSTRVIVQVGEDTGYIYSNSGTIDYGYEYLINLPGYYSGDVYTGTTLNGFNKLNDLTLGYSGSGSALDPATLAALAIHRVGGSDVIGDLAPDTAELMLITIYVEGWDAQCTNSIISAQLSLTFSIGFVA